MVSELKNRLVTDYYYLNKEKVMKNISLHVIHSFPASCLNRDDNGSPKTFNFGGCQRATVSSQCWKRAIRQAMKNNEVLGKYTEGIRTAKIADYIKQNVVEREEVTDENIDIVSEKIQIIYTTTKTNEKTDEESPNNTLVFFSKKEIATLIDGLFNNEDSVKELIDKTPFKKNQQTKKYTITKACKRVKKSIFDLYHGIYDDMLDIIMFGRMNASDDSMNIMGVTAFNFAMSTHKINTQLDYFTGVDDFTESQGSAYLGYNEYNASCYYRYININVEKFYEMTADVYTNEEQDDILKSLIKTIVVTSPEAKWNSMAAKTLPDYVVGTIQNGNPYVMSNAFIKPVKQDNLIENSIETLENYMQKQKENGNLEYVEVKFPENKLEEFVAKLV